MATPTPRELAADPNTPMWAVDVIRFLLRGDPVDAANTLEALAAAFRERADRILEEGGRARP